MTWKPGLWMNCVASLNRNQREVRTQKSQLKVWCCRSSRIAAALVNVVVCFDYSKILFCNLGIFLRKDFASLQFRLKNNWSLFFYLQCQYWEFQVAYFWLPSILFLSCEGKLAFHVGCSVCKIIFGSLKSLYLYSFRLKLNSQLLHSDVETTS